MIGVYQIINLKNDKRYIGSSLHLEKRWIQHAKQLKLNIHHAKKLQRSYNKYGFDFFIYEILEICTKEDMIKIEQYYIDFYDSYKKGYNSVPNAGNNIGLKMSKEAKEKLRCINLGKKHSQETKNKIREKLSGRKKPNFSELEKNRLRTINCKKVSLINGNGDIIKKYESITKCSLDLNIKRGVISDIAYGKLMPYEEMNFKFI